MQIHCPPVLVIGGGSANGLGIARNLGRLGIPVYCLTSNPHEWMLRSKYCRGYTLIPRIEDDPLRLQQVLTALRARWSQPCVLFPTTDIALLTVSTLYPGWAGHRARLPHPEVLATCVLKKRFYKSLRTHGIPHPRTWYPEETDIAAIAADLTYPVFIRPSDSLRFVHAFTYKGLIAHTPAEVQKQLHFCQSRGFDVLVQDIIPGATTDGYAIRGYIDRQDRLIALLATQKVRQPRLFANSNIKVSIPLTSVQEAADHLVRYLQAIRYQGLFGGEFKRDPRNGELKLLEINARSMGGNAIAAACGMNDVLAAYRDAVGEEVQPFTTYESDHFHIDLTRDLRILLYRLRHHQLTMRDLDPYLRKKAWQFWSFTDGRPFLHFLRTSLSATNRAKLLSLPPG
jgi:predicted ATP-grasp superfamily ATP-dependent carboligase